MTTPADAPQTYFPVLMCEASVSAFGHTAAVVKGVTLKMPVANHKRILVLGNTGWSVRRRTISEAARHVMDELEGLFPIPLLRSRGLFDPAMVVALTDEIRSVFKQRNDRSDRLSHTEIVRPDANPLYREVARIAEEKIVEFGTLLFGDRLRWAVKEMWTNVLEPGGSQSLHAHANSFVSGIIYLTPSHPSSHTVFVRNPGGTEFSFRHNTRTAQIGPFNAGKYVTPEIEPGDMVLFPSYLLHEVPRNQGAQRITMAFNAIPDRLDSWGYSIGLTP